MAALARLEGVLARAICVGFWKEAPAPRRWEHHSALAQEIFQALARRAIEVARDLRLAGQMAADAREERLAEALCATFFELSELSPRWSDFAVRQTFHDAARAALTAGREFREQTMRPS